MPVPPVSNTTAPPTAVPPRAPQQTMDGDSFMKIFLVTLQNQDPTEPMSTSEMMQSTATLSQMQMLSSLGTVMEGLTLSQNQATATGLIGKSITYIDATTGLEVTGKVEGVSMSSSTPVLLINDKRVPLGLVSTVND